jgi:hypothetical protein
MPRRNPRPPEKAVAFGLLERTDYIYCSGNPAFLIAMKLEKCAPGIICFVWGYPAVRRDDAARQAQCQIDESAKAHDH